MKILVSGSSGLIGSALVDHLAGEKHAVFRLVRSKLGPDAAAVYWNPRAGDVDPQGLEGCNAVVHLAGESIVGRWTEAKKKEIKRSRVEGTRLLCEALAKQHEPPHVMACASAIGVYGNRGDEILTESSPPGTGFLAEVGREWEAATEAAERKGIRVVHLRIGVVLSRAGGALAKMLLPFRLGLGGVVGNGRQYMSWIALDDVVRAVAHVLQDERFSGPVNIVAPNAVTNREFTKTLGRVLRRPTILAMPAFFARLALGELAAELALSSTRVKPERLLERGFEFHHTDLEPTLRHLCQSPAP